MAVDEPSGPWFASLEACAAKKYWQLDLWVGRILEQPHWKARALFLVLSVSLFRAFPSYDALSTPFAQATWQHAQTKIEHPLVDMSRLFPPGSHESKLTFRMAAPVLAHVLHIRQPGLMALSMVAGLLLLYCVLSVTYRLTGSRKAAAYTCMATACTWPGATAFHELRGGYYDAIAICALIGALCSVPSVVTAACVFVAAWTDERAPIASSLVFVFWMTEDRTSGRPRFSSKHVGIVLGIAAYIATRAYITATYSLTPIVLSGGVGWRVLSGQMNVIPWAVWTGLAGQWLLVGCGVAAAWLQKQRMIALLLCVALACVMGAAVCVIDITRSIAYCLPAVFVAMSLLRREPTRWLERVAFMSCLVSVIFPTYYLEGSAGMWWLYPLPVQVVRWTLPLLVHRL
jgi:hypothetical protein